MYTRRPDAIGFINGLPLVLMEFKRIDENVYAAYHDNLRDYKDTIPHLFWYNALIILSNGSESRVGRPDSELGTFHRMETDWELKMRGEQCHWKQP